MVCHYNLLNWLIYIESPHNLCIHNVHQEYIDKEYDLAHLPFSRPTHTRALRSIIPYHAHPSGIIDTYHAHPILNHQHFLGCRTRFWPTYPFLGPTHTRALRSIIPYHAHPSGIIDTYHAHPILNHQHFLGCRTRFWPTYLFYGPFTKGPSEASFHTMPTSLESSIPTMPTPF